MVAGQVRVEAGSRIALQCSSVLGLHDVFGEITLLVRKPDPSGPPSDHVDLSPDNQPIKAICGESVTSGPDVVKPARPRRRQVKLVVATSRTPGAYVSGCSY